MADRTNHRGSTSSLSELRKEGPTPWPLHTEEEASKIKTKDSKPEQGPVHARGMPHSPRASRDARPPVGPCNLKGAPCASALSPWLVHSWNVTQDLWAGPFPFSATHRFWTTTPGAQSEHPTLAGFFSSPGGPSPTSPGRLPWPNLRTLSVPVPRNSPY